MEKAPNLMILGMLLLVLSFSLASANTLVGGKIYNSDFSEVVQGADVIVDCGGDTLETLSLSDGAYAVTFDSDACYSANHVDVTASKATSSGQGKATINNSTEEEGEYVAVANINIKSKSSGSSGSSVTVHRGTWFLCGNTVCDSGETPQTCSKDCKVLPEENTTLVPLVAPVDNSANNGNNMPSTENQTDESGNNAPGITGAVTGDLDGDGAADRMWYILGILVLILIVAIVAISVIRDSRKEKWEDVVEK